MIFQKIKQKIAKKYELKLVFSTNNSLNKFIKIKMKKKRISDPENLK